MLILPLNEFLVLVGLMIAGIEDMKRPRPEYIFAYEQIVRIEK